MGFDAIWISPIVVNFPEGYHGYWAKDWFSVNPYFGTAEDLKVTFSYHPSMRTSVTHLLLLDVGQYLPQNGYLGPLGRRRQSLRLYLKLLRCTLPFNTIALNSSFQITPFNKAEHYHTECTITNWDNPIGM